MKKLVALLTAGLLILPLAACSSGNTASSSAAAAKEETITIGVTPEPHARIVQLVVDDLKKEGVDLKIVEFTDYVKPNTALADKELDANFFQHVPYLEDFNAKNKTNLVSIGGIHIEPMALYSKKYKAIDELPEGAKIAVPNDTVNGGRALLLLQSNNLLKLKDGAGLEATEQDIAENPKKLQIIPMEAASLPRVLEDVDGAVINGNFALQAELNPVKDGLIVEGKDSPYVNVIVVRADEASAEKFQKLIKALQSEKVKKFIEDTYQGAVVPTF